MNRKKGLDELQVKRRNSIGNQMFVLLFYILIFEAGLHGAGFRWLNYPANIVVIASICMGVYLVRLFINNAYLSPSSQRRKIVIALIMASIFFVALIGAGVYLYSQQQLNGTLNSSSLLLVIVPAVGLLISLIVFAIQKSNDKFDED